MPSQSFNERPFTRRDEVSVEVFIDLTPRGTEPRQWARLGVRLGRISKVREAYSHSIVAGGLLDTS